tara:strand:+ start:494 stop:634 length:141 start_codon:yes stop_codon:yes gene_type:complete
MVNEVSMPTRFGALKFEGNGVSLPGLFENENAEGYTPLFFFLEKTP